MQIDYEHAYGELLLEFKAKLQGGREIDVVERVTDIFEHAKGPWLIVHEHAFVPMDVLNEKLYVHATE